MAFRIPPTQRLCEKS